MEYVLTNLWLKKNKQGSIRKSLKEVSDDKVVLKESQTEAVNENNRARSSNRVPMFWNVNEISRLKFPQDARQYRNTDDTYSMPS